ncbi:MAG: methyltransferase [Clostridia bacterium]|nr:methyltransferase [Clostridia bacterium]
MQELYEDERMDQVNDHISLIAKKDGLTFGTDAFLLASFVKPKPRGRAVELGTGTGIVSLLLAGRHRFGTIHAVEVQKDFAELAERNVRLNRMEDRIAVHHADLRELRPEQIGGEADAVLANPPYMRTDTGKRNESDRKYIARHEVFGGIEDFCLCASRLLKHSGSFVCVYRPDRLADLMSALRVNRLEPKVMVFVHADGESEPSMVLLSAKKGGASGMRILPPLLLHDSSETEGVRTLGKRAQAIYDTLSFWEE